MYKTITLLVALAIVSIGSTARAEYDQSANRTRYPIVFAHGMGGFDDILGYDYWGDDYGVFVLDPCNEWFETSCNGSINDNQKSYISQVTPFESSEVRGLQLTNNIESYMASAGTSYVNIVGHSQGGMDARKAAKLLRQRRGYRAVRYLMSISSPHRGSPVAKAVLDDFGGSQAETLANYFGNVVYRGGNNVNAALKFLVYDDYDPNDGVTTGARTFNERYNVNSNHVTHYRSFLTAQGEQWLNSALWLTTHLGYGFDGDGYCVGDGDNDGAAGCGDGKLWDNDDDGLVGINSQQMGNRMYFVSELGQLDEVYATGDHGFVGDLNNPNSQQMTSHAHVMDLDHLDIIGVGPDTFDEMEFYAAITDFIADTGE